MSDGVRLCLATPRDAARIAAMSRVLVETGLRWRWTPNAIARRIADPETEVLVARAGDAIVGFAILQFEEDDAHMLLFAVDPRCRRRRVGTRLFTWLLESSRTAGLVMITLEVRARNHGARAFYRRLGFAEIEHLQGYYQGKEDAVRMVADLRVNV